ESVSVELEPEMVGVDAVMVGVIQSATAPLLLIMWNMIPFPLHLCRI
ncbi:hypothetical protein Tsp_10566, partial [Trichinella spiralis]